MIRFLLPLIIGAVIYKWLELSADELEEREKQKETIIKETKSGFKVYTNKNKSDPDL